MTDETRLTLLFLHALPLDGRMWQNQMSVFQEHAYAPDLYDFGPDIEDWAAEALNLVPAQRLIVVGCPVGG